MIRFKDVPPPDAPKPVPPPEREKTAVDVEASPSEPLARPKRGRPKKEAKAP